jgi:DNA-binding transcriptional ArsR family regulator
MLPIRQHLLTLTCLKSTAKTVLVEVCELAENGKKGGCFVSNATLARDLGISLATVTRTVASLVEAGLLTSHIVKAEANRRYLQPTSRLRACYVGGTEAQQLAAATNLTIVKTAPESTFDYSQNEPETELTIVKNDSDYSQNGSLTIVKNDSDYSQNASRVLGDDHYDQLDDQHDQRLTPGERVRLEKKIEELQQQVTTLKAQLALTKAPPVPAAPAVGYRVFTADWPEQLRPPFRTPAFLAAWAAFAGYRDEIGKSFRGNIGEQQALDTLGTFAAGDMQRALRILTHNITQGYRTLTNDDGTQSPRKSSGPGAGTSPGRVEALPTTSYGRNRGPASTPAEPAAASAA